MIKEHHTEKCGISKTNKPNNRSKEKRQGQWYIPLLIIFGYQIRDRKCLIVVVACAARGDSKMLCGKKITTPGCGIYIPRKQAPTPVTIHISAIRTQ